MKRLSLLIIILTFFGCNQKEGEVKFTITETNTKKTEEDETIFWVDTISNDKFLKIYSIP